ncbi:hypothetical protein ACTFIY_001905 [Dictyostelium cf. discoideum]
MNESIFIKEFIKILIKCKFGNEEDWFIEIIDKVWIWGDKFQIKIISRVNENKELLIEPINKIWNDSLKQISSEMNLNKICILNLQKEISFKYILQFENIKEFILSLFLNNLLLTEYQLLICLNSFFNNNNNNNNLSLNVINKIREISSKNSFNNLLKDFNLKFQESIFGVNFKTNINDNKNNNELFLFPSIHINENLESRAIAQLLLNNFLKIQANKEKEEIDPETINVISNLYNNDTTVFLWLLLILSFNINNNNNNNNFNNNNNNSNNYNNLIGEMLTLIEKSKLVKKVKFFLCSDNNLLMSVTKLNFNFFQLYQDALFSLIEYYLFNENSKEINIDSDYLNYLNSSLLSLLQLTSPILINQPTSPLQNETNNNNNNNNSITSIRHLVLNSINQRIFATKTLKTNEISKGNVLKMLIDLKNSNSIKK